MNLITRNWRGLLMIALGLGTILSAHFVLDTCADAGKFMSMGSMGGMGGMGSAATQIHMGCTWTERAVQGVGGLVAVIGLVMLWARESVRGLALAAAGAGVLMVLIPVWLVPTCATPTMVCNLSLKPGSILLGSVVALAGLGSAIRVRAAGDAPAGGQRQAAHGA